MVIGKINRVFEKYGAIIFALFAVLIIMAFMPGLSGLFMGTGTSNDVGKYYNESISLNELQLEHNQYATAIALQYNATPGQVKQNVTLEQFFDTLCMLKKAESLGLKVSQNEVAEFIHKIGSLQTEKKFDKDKFDDFINNNNIKKDLLDAGIAKIILTQKLQEYMTDNIVVTDNEILNHYNYLNEEITVKKAEFKAMDYLKDIKIDDTKLEVYLTENIKSYMTPKQYKVQLASYLYSDFEKQAVVSAEEIKASYDKNKDTYKKPVDPKAKKEETKEEYKNLKEVEKEIKKNLISEKAKEIALNASQLFATEAYKAIEDTELALQLDVLKQFAITNKTSLKLTDWFSSESKKAINEEYAILTSIEKIDKEVPLTNAVKGSKGVYVAYLLETKASEKPLLKDVKEKVTSAFKAEKSKALAKEAATQFAKEFSEALTKGTAFDKIKDTDKFVKNLPFIRKTTQMDQRTLAMYMQYRIPLPENMTINNLIKNIKVNEISEIGVNNRNGNPLIVYLEKTELPKIEDFEKVKETIKTAVVNAKMMAISKEFQDSLKANCGLYSKEK